MRSWQQKLILASNDDGHWAKNAMTSGEFAALLSGVLRLESTA